MALRTDSEKGEILNNLVNKHIVLGITGGIAAYKSADLVRRLREVGAHVRVVMTAGAKAFITPLTLQAVSANPVHEDLFDLQAEAAMGHIELAKWADLILIAPASANFLAQLTHGFAPDLLTTLCLATEAPIIVAPAMNQRMWRHPRTQENIKRLINQEIKILMPESGEQACGDIGPGRLMAPIDIVAALNELFQSTATQQYSLANKRVLITAGPTQEAIDPVRFLSNHSSGKMGYAIAQAAVEAGAEVVLVSGITSLAIPAKVRYIAVISALDMHAAVIKEVKHCDIFIGAAAVADFRCVEVAKDKIKKTNEDTLTLQLIKNPDILAEVAKQKKRPLVVGFAAETNHVLENARQKLKQKNLDIIVANEVGEGRGFGTDQHTVTIITAKEEKVLLPAKKIEIARQLIEFISVL